MVNILSLDLIGLVALKREVNQAVYFPEINNVDSMFTSISTNTNKIIKTIMKTIILLADNGDCYIIFITTTVNRHLERKMFTFGIS